MSNDIHSHDVFPGRHTDFEASVLVRVGISGTLKLDLGICPLVRGKPLWLTLDRKWPFANDSRAR